jgi:hypothetical protein
MEPRILWKASAFDVCGGTNSGEGRRRVEMLVKTRCRRPFRDRWWERPALGMPSRRGSRLLGSVIPPCAGCATRGTTATNSRGDEPPRQGRDG